MRAFSELYHALDCTTSSRQKTEIMARYFQSVESVDAAWAVYFLAGGKLKRLLPTSQLRVYAQQQTDLAPWLFEACYQSVGDLAETISLVLPETMAKRNERLSDWVSQALLPLRSMEPQQQLDHLHTVLSGWDAATKFVCLKLLTGGLRVGVSRLLVTRALALASGLPHTLIAQRLVGYLSSDQHPSASHYESLIQAGPAHLISPGQPYPFFLAQSCTGDSERLDADLGCVQHWQLEYKWDGIRAQLVYRSGQIWIWSRGEELITEQFPDLLPAVQCLPDSTVLDGEILVWHPNEDLPAPFAQLQKRLGRKRLSTTFLEQYPVAFMSYDILESNGRDCRQDCLAQRRKLLESTLQPLQSQTLRLSEVLHAQNWQEAVMQQQQARQVRAEGLMIKELSSRYGIGRTRQAGLWLKYKLDPMTIDAVLIYAQKGHGRRANLYTDYTFAVWHKTTDDELANLVPVAKAYSGLTDEEIRQVDAIIKKSTLESFGPVRRVQPQLVFEIGFEGILPSSRHKSGVALRFPRMLRWRTDKSIQDADSLDQLKALL